MTRHLPARLGLAAALALGLFLLAPSFRSPAASPDGALSDAMKGLVDGLKGLSKSLASAENNADSLAHIAAMQRHALAAKALPPANLSKIEEKDRRAHQMAYRADMARLLSELCAMEIDVCEGRNEEAMGRIRGGLIPLRNASHEKYQDE